ncbi:MAG: ATP-dependent DNA helicase RecG, partial [Lachnospiraceae bacterium]
MKVDSPLRDIKGVGPKTQMLLEKLGLFTARDLITFFPRDYEHYGPPVDETELIEGQIGVVEGFVTARPKVRASG